MENPFNLSDDKLKELLNTYFDWSNKNEQDKLHPERERQKSEEREKTLLNSEYLQTLSDDELTNEILKYSKELEGPVQIRIGKPRVLGEIEKLKRNLMYIVNSREDPFVKADKILEGSYRIPIFSKSFWSPLFRAKYPELLPNWNNKTDRFLKKIGINLTTSKKTVKEKYKLFSEAFKFLKNLDDRHDFYTLDHLTHYGEAINEGVQLIERLTNPSFEGFSEKAFQLLETLIKDTSYEAVSLISENIHREITNPLRKLFQEIATGFDTRNILNLEKEKNIMGHLFKVNPKLGAYPYIWGAFYQKSQSRNTSMQFFVALYKDYLSCGVYSSEKNPEIKNRIIKNLIDYKDELKEYLNDEFFRENYFYGLPSNDEETHRKNYRVSNIEELIQLYKEVELNIGKVLAKDEVINEGLNLVDKIRDIFNRLVPAYVLGITVEPNKFLKDYYEQEIKYWRIIEPFDTKNYVLWPTCKEKGIIAIGYLDNSEASDVVKMKEKMNIGDKVIAYLGEGRIGGIGTVTGEFEDYSDTKPKEKNLFNGNFWRRRKVNWYQLPKNGEFWKVESTLPGARTTVFELNKEKYDEILNEIAKPIEIYTKEKILKEIFISEKDFDQIIKLLKNSKKKQLILQGPPGTGKTFIAQRIARYITQNKELIETIQFHPSYSYEDFIEGYRPFGDGFKLCDGIFKEFCKIAEANHSNDYVLIIDEINRGNLSKIFGELLYLLEYRNEKVKLTYSQEEFHLPENLYIIGTMNTADRSLAIMDYALRRRFYFKSLHYNPEKLGEWLRENDCQINSELLLIAIKNMNESISKAMHCIDYNIGHSYFMRENLEKEDLEEIILFELEPLLHEYFFDKYDKIAEVIAPLKNALVDENIQNDE